jgi:hypothetical protein
MTELKVTNDPKFWRLRLVELIQIRECQLRGEKHDLEWWSLVESISTDNDTIG